ncbi:RHS repeat-associated protein [Comamonas sp. BIGb0152]|uniref:RHS repeat-associated core domain-containing protein n=1 Tax=Comamonas sp. BIGb0152 TaxID=2940601 RepID=UPI002168E862|nr:RHS repeat-associated core domain-containing protein [Comamonas sp. BIGb0152]MCS4294221.1 RHS repeat-associated protein [Comamonas sp. BIGb0152]
MSGQPAARKGDRVAKGKIVQGSRTVLIGSQGGIACSECPGGITVSSPVNPQIGAKVLLGEEDLDFALPGALPLVWQRRYSSYVNPSHGAACGLLGYGWRLWHELSVALQEDSTLLFDANGRVITFDEPLPPGGQLYSASEGLWLLRGGGSGGDGKDAGTAPWASDARWRHIAPALARSADTILAASGNGDTLWHLGTVPTQAPPGGATDRWRLLAVSDRLGRIQRYQYSDGSQRDATHSRPLPLGMLVALIDGAGRHYRLRQQRIHNGKKAQDPHALWGADDGWRLVSVELFQDPVTPLRGSITLVRYGYSDEGDLVTVHNRANALVRTFQWDHHRISAHRIAQGPWHHYRYESKAPGARVIEHSNQEGLGYRFDYQPLPDSPQGLPRASTRVSDSLGRVETYHFEGAPGLSRLVAHDKADGSRWLQAYDAFGRLTCSTDPLARSTYLRRDGQGRITGMQLPGGGSTQQHYDDATGRLLHSTDAAGACTRYQYDQWGRVTQTTQADGSYERYHYPSPSESPLHCDSPLRIEDAHGASKRLSWSNAGQLLSYTDCSGHTSHYRYDRYGALAETTDARGVPERYLRDEQGRLVAIEWQGPLVERYHYNEAGHLVRIDPAQKTDSPPSAGHADQAGPADHSIHLSYDLWGRLLQRSQGGLSISLEYDSAGRLTRLVNENGAQSRFAWDTQDRLVLEEGFDQRLQRYQWDAAGQLRTSSDGNAMHQSTTRYTWDSSARLAQRQWPATAHAPAQTHHYQWNAAGQLTAASVWLQPVSAEDAGQPLPAQLQSQISLQRDALGRITGEVQQLYRSDSNGHPAPSAALEYEHRISHGLDALGNRQHSHLQGLGTIAWQRYGAGHVHGLQHNGNTLVDMERDALHRETRRSLGAPGQADGPTPIQVQRQWDSLGRLSTTATQGLQLPTSADPAAPPLALHLVGQIAGRRYRYDALGQLSDIEQAGAGGQPAQLLRYAYDTAGRLRASAEGLRPTSMQEWRTDPAGNRLPGPAPSADNPGSDSQQWAAQVHAHWRQESFNLLGLGHLAAYQRGPVKQWDDNRIGYSSDCVWRYDEFGRRIEQLQSLATNAQGQPQRSRQELRYDGNHQLIEVHTAYSDGRPAQQLRYTYDALGRRLSKKSSTAAAEHTSYYGWDGERLIHTEHLRPGPDSPDGQPCRHIEHTIYEDGSFTPLVRLSTTAQLSEHQQPPLLLRALQAGMAGGDSSDGDSGSGGNSEADDSNTQALALMQSMLSAMPASMQEQAEQNMQQALQSTAMPASSAFMGETAQRGAQLLQGMREQLQRQQQQAHARIATHYYHCDHLGTPLALTDSKGQIAWAARLDPWGNVLDEYDPHGIGQPMRLPGQIHDLETGLYYNRHRYYDPQVGGYITQDPIGLAGGTNKSKYPLNPMMWIDPLGLDPTQPPARGPDLGKTKDWWDKAQDILSWKENVEKGREIKKEQDILMCKAEKEISDRVENDQLTPEAAKLALAAKKLSIYADGPISAAVENIQSGFIVNSQISYGYYTSPSRNCVDLLQSTHPTFDFFK